MDWMLPAGDTYFKAILERTPEGFEIDHLDEALKYCTRFHTAIDGGAHIGTWSVHMAMRFERVFAFEPAVDTYSCLVHNTLPYNNVCTQMAALGACVGRGMVVEDPTRVGNTGSRIVTDVGDAVSRGTIVMAVDNYNFADLDFLKLDVEGNETLALEGARETIVRCRPTIMVECKKFNPPRNGGPEATIAFLDTLGYCEVGGIRNDRVFVPNAR